MRAITTIYLALTALGILLPISAIAGGAGSNSITLTGEAKALCQLPLPSAKSANNSTFDGNKISIAQLLDEDTAMVKDSETNISYGVTMCNYAAFLSVSSQNGGMTRTSGTDTAVAGSGAFLDIIDYTVSVDWGSVKIANFDTALHRTDRKAVTQASGANQAELLVKVSTQKGNTPVLRGTYTDVITVNVGPIP